MFDSPFIRTLAADEKISEPGFYNISLDVHHSQPCVGPSVTSGVLRKMELYSPADVWAFSLLNPDRWPSTDKPALRLGRAMAAYVEGGMKEVERHFMVLPDDKPNRPTAAQKLAYKEGRGTEAGINSIRFWQAVERDKRDVLSGADLKMIADMGRVLAADPVASAVMGGMPEITMAWQDELTGLWVLSRPDTVSFDGSVSDFKKISTQGAPLTHRLVDRKIEQYGYHQQMALACEGFEKLTFEWPTSVGLVFQTDVPPHHVMLRGIGEEELRIGQWQNRRSLDRFAECLSSGVWPGPGWDSADFQMSKFLRESLLEQMQMASAAP